MIELTKELARCLEVFKSRHEFYKGIDLKIAAIRYNDSWHNVRTKILPVASDSSAKQEKLIDLENFVIIHHSLELDMFADLLRNIGAGSLRMAGYKVNFFADPMPSLSLNDYYRNDSQRSKEQWNIEWPIDWYSWRQDFRLGPELRSVFVEVDRELPCYNPPFKSMEEAVTEILELPKYNYQGSAESDSRCEILLPNYIALERVRLVGNKLEITAKCHVSIDQKDLFLSVIGYGRETTRSRQNLANGRTRAMPPFLRIRKSFRIDDVAEVQVYLSATQIEKLGHSDQRSARNVKSILNPRVASHEVFDESSMRLMEWFEGKSRRDIQHSFEYSVATLLHMCGFETEWLGYHGMVNDAPDILAFCSEPELLVVGECTTKAPDTSKYKALKERAQILRDRIRLDVYPVMFTTMKLSNDEKNESWKHDCSIVTSTELRDLHDMAVRAKTMREVLYVMTGRNL